MLRIATGGGRPECSADEVIPGLLGIRRESSQGEAIGLAAMASAATPRNAFSVASIQRAPPESPSRRAGGAINNVSPSGRFCDECVKEDFASFDEF
jgi:hypothetical protein